MKKVLTLFHYYALKCLVRKLNPGMPLYNTTQNFAGASGPAYVVILKILRVPKGTSKKFVGAAAPVAPVLTRPL